MKKPDQVRPEAVVADDRIAALMSKIKQEPAPDRLLDLARQVQSALDAKQDR